jgi:hypothetical protein
MEYHMRAHVRGVALLLDRQGRQAPCEGLSLRIAGEASQLLQLHLPLTWL